MVFNLKFVSCFQGNFFQNLGSILLFAIFGTIISAVLFGGGVYLLGVVRCYGLTLYSTGMAGLFTLKIDPVGSEQKV